MDQQELLDRWEQQQEKLNLPPLPDGTQAYITEGGEMPDMSRIAGSKWMDMPNVLADALDSEQGDMAARMLRVLGEIRREGPISLRPYGGGEDVCIDIRVCAMTGQPFGGIVEKLIRARDDDYRLEDYTTCAQVLAKWYPEETRRFAEMTPRQAPAAEDDWPEKMRCLLRVLCCTALAEQGNAEYTPMILAGLDSLPQKHRAEVLRTAYPLSDALKARAVQEAKEDYSTLWTISYAKEHNDAQAEQVLTELGIPLYRHILKARSKTYTETISAYFLELYRTKPEEVHWTCQQLLMREKTDNAHAAGLPIAAMLCHFGDGKEELPAAEQLLPTIMNTYTTPFELKGKGEGSAWQLIRDCAEGKEEYNVIKGRVTAPDGIVGRCFAVYEPLGALSLYSPKMKKLLEVCARLCADQKMYRGLMHLYCGGLVGMINWCEEKEENAVRQMLSGGCPREAAYYSYAYVTWQYSGRNYATKGPVLALLRENPGDAAAFLASPWLDGVDATLVWLELMYGEYGETDCVPLCKQMNDKSKKLRAACAELLAPQEAVARPILEKQLPAMKGEPAKLVKKLLRTWDNERKFGKDFALATNEIAADFAKENLDTDNLNLIAWIPPELLAGVRFADLSAEAPAACMQFLLVEYMGMTEAGRLPLCDKVAERLAPQDLATALGAIYENWMSSGAEAKKKNILLPYCIYGTDTQVLGMRHQMETWAEASRGALAAFAAQAAALNGGSAALMMIDGIAAKFPNNQVKNAAKDAFAFAAAALGVPKDVLSDRIVPTLGFSQAGKKTVDYGARTFTLTLQPDFSLDIRDDEKGKSVKSLPKPGASDDAVKAEAARKEVSELKKQLKATVATQKTRLEKVLQNGRTWDAATWQKLFAENPVMHCFATGLVWGCYKDGSLTDTFRYLDDGSFTTAAEEEYVIPADAKISLAHPCEMDAALTEAWKRQLADYEVVPPLAQLSAPLTALKPEDVQKHALLRYDGQKSTVAKMTGLAKKYGMRRGDVLDAGSYTCFFWEDDFLQAGIQLNFEYMYMGQEYSEEVPLEKFYFYRLPLHDLTSDEIPENQRIDPAVLPRRWLCSVLSALDTLVEQPKPEEK